MRTRPFLHRCLTIGLVLAGCGPEKIYVYPDGWAPKPPEDTGEDSARPGDAVADASRPDGDTGVPLGDVSPPPETVVWDLPPAPDMDFPDVVHLDGLLPEDAPPPETHHFPEVTDNCDPLGLPTQWTGTFDGEITSNIPDFAGYTFNGAVEGAISFEIQCVNQKYLVVGVLDGGSTNCALPSGCPFTAKLGGFYNPQTQHLSGQVVDAVIDYALVKVHCEGVFEGDLTGGSLTGTWSGTKTEIENLAIPLLDLSWVEAGGQGTWTTAPVGE